MTYQLIVSTSFNSENSGADNILCNAIISLLEKIFATIYNLIKKILEQFLVPKVPQVHPSTCYLGANEPTIPIPHLVSKVPRSHDGTMESVRFLLIYKRNWSHDGIDGICYGIRPISFNLQEELES